MIDKELSKKATAEDFLLLETVHPLGAKLLTFIGGKWRLKKVPLIGTVISDPEMIREIYMNKVLFSKNGKGASTSFWNPIIGNYGLLNMDGTEHRDLKRTVFNMFSKDRVEGIVAEVTKPILAKATEQLRGGESVDMVTIASEIAYRTTWKTVGFSEERLASINIHDEVVNLREVTEGVNPIKKKMSAAQIEKSRSKLTLVDTLVNETYNNDDDSLPALLRREGYSQEVAASLTKSIFIAGTETVIGFLPRMTALFLKTRYVDYLTTHPEHISRGVDEALRVTVPTPVAARVVVENTDFHNVKLKAGQRLLLSTIGASKKQGDFDPFAEPNKALKSLWFGAGVHMCIGVGTALAQAHLVAEFLADISMDEELEIVSQTSNDKGHTGSYKELVIACKPSSN